MKNPMKLFVAAAACLALLSSAAASASTNSSSCSCPSGASATAPLSSPSGPESIFYRPFLAMQEELDRLNQDMNRLMQEALYAPGGSAVAHEQLYARINMETTPNEYRITMTAPGLDEKDLQVNAGPDIRSPFAAKRIWCKKPAAEPSVPSAPSPKC